MRGGRSSRCVVLRVAMRSFQFCSTRRSTKNIYTWGVWGANASLADGQIRGKFVKFCGSFRNHVKSLNEWIVQVSKLFLFLKHIRINVFVFRYTVEHARYYHVLGDNVKALQYYSQANIIDETQCEGMDSYAFLLAKVKFCGTTFYNIYFSASTSQSAGIVGHKTHSN